VHELALMQAVVDSVVEQVGSEEVVVVRVEVGELAGVATASLGFSFESCTRDTPLANATLEIVRVPAVARCRACAREAPTSSFVEPCTCGSFDRELVAGGELRLVEVEVR